MSSTVDEAYSFVGERRRCSCRDVAGEGLREADLAGNCGWRGRAEPAGLGSDDGIASVTSFTALVGADFSLGLSGSEILGAGGALAVRSLDLLGFVSG